MTGINDDSQNKTPIVLLKTKSMPHDGYEELFLAAIGAGSYKPIFLPVLEHKFFDDGLQIVRELLQQKQIGKSKDTKYGGLIFTSQRAVEAFARLVEEDNNDEGWPHLQDIPIYTVGPATSRALRSIGVNPPLNIDGADCGNGQALAHYMLDHYGEWYKDHKIKPPLLFLVGEQRRDIIPKTLMDPSLPDTQRIQVDELIIYGTGVMETFEEDFCTVLNKTSHQSPRWVIVFSPTGCEAMLRALNILDEETHRIIPGSQNRRDGTYIATIGPTTRDFLMDTFGFTPDVCAEKPSPEGVQEAIRRFMGVVGKSLNSSIDK